MKISLDLSDDISDALKQLAEKCSDCSAIRDGFATHGAQMTAEKLLTLFAEDASKIITDPQSWQSENIIRVLASHGYMIKKGGG